MTDPVELLDQLDQAHAAATPGPWDLDYDGDVVPKDRANQWIAITTQAPNGALIVTAVNALPQLTAALRAVLARAEEWDGWQENARRYAAAHPEEADIARARELAYRRATDNLRTAVASALTADPTNQEGTR